MAGYINPAREQFNAFKALPRDEPIDMLNLIRLRSSADYEPEHPDFDTDVTGEAAYATYRRATHHILARVGAREIWAGHPQGVVTGPADEQWDLAFIISYPGASALLAMVADAEYQRAAQHRTAAVEDSRLIRVEQTQSDLR